MVKVSEIKDRESLEEWLLDRPEDETKQFAVSIAHRAAMRVLPVYWEWRIEPTEEHYLTAFRCNLISGVARKMPTPEIRDAAFAARATANAAEESAMAISVDTTYDTAAASAISAAAFAVSTAASTSPLTANSSALAAASAAADAAHFFVDAETGSELAAANAPAVLWKQIRTDCAALETGDMLLASPLWNGDENPFQKEWEAVRNSLPVATPARSEETARGALPVDWSFWINWYQDALEGREPDWDMLYEIALIPDEDWQKGPVHINNQVIAGIVEKYRLRRDVQDFRKELKAVRKTTIAPIGHNNPPERIENEAEAVAVTQFEIIWEASGEAEEELSKPKPSPTVLKRIGTVILRAIAEVGKYGAKLGDVVLKATAATVGGGVGAYLISKGPEIQLWAEQLLEYVEKFIH